MPTIRRLYLYLMALISLLALLVGLVGLTWVLIGSWLNAQPYQIKLDEPGASSLALWTVIVAISAAVWATHWRLANRTAGSLVMAGAAERGAPERKAYFYDGMFGALIALVLQAGLLVYDLLLHLLAGEAALSLMVLGPAGQGGQPIRDVPPDTLGAWPAGPASLAVGGLIAGAFWLYLYRRARADGDMGHEPASGAAWRRAYQYVSALLGTALAALGAAEFLSAVLTLAGQVVMAPGEALAAAGWREVVAASLAALVTGLPLAWLTWRHADWLAADDPGGVELNSLWRKMTIYAGLIAGVLAALVCSGFLVLVVTQAALGQPVNSPGAFWAQTLAPPLAYLPVALVLWWIFDRMLRNDMDWATESYDAAGLRRLYFYLMAILTVAGFWYGLQQVLSAALFLLLGWLPLAQLETPATRSALSLALALLAACGPAWWWHWHSAQGWARQPGPAGHEERTSLMRKIYLYGVIVVAAGVVVATLGVMIYRAPSWLFDPAGQSEFVSSLVQFGVAVALALTWWIAHGMVMRTDAAMIAAEAGAAGYEAETVPGADASKPAWPVEVPPPVVVAALGARSFARDRLPAIGPAGTPSAAVPEPKPVAVVDGGNGMVGSMLLAELQRALPNATLWPIALNPAAQAAMNRALGSPTGPNVPADALEQAVTILGPGDIVMPGGLDGEVPPELAAAVMESPARKILLPARDPRLRWVATPVTPLEQWVKQAVAEAAATANGTS